MRLSGQKPSPTTRRWIQRPRVVLLGLIGANVAVFITQLFLDAYQPGFVREYLALSDRGLRSAYGWQFISAAFLHDGPWHLLGNMFLLYLLGRDVESIIGQRQFLFLYLTGTLAGELGHLFPHAGKFRVAGGFRGTGGSSRRLCRDSSRAGIDLHDFFPAANPAEGKTSWLRRDRSCWAGNHFRSRGNGRAQLLPGGLHCRLVLRAHAWIRPTLYPATCALPAPGHVERHNAMTPEEFIAQEIDPLLEKISRDGMGSLTRAERRLLAKAREKIEGKD
jgi:Uncharacterized membrane protein (homolog of Drosophila rhomboid)